MNKMTVTQYNPSLDEFTIHLENEGVDILVPAIDFAVRYESHRHDETLSAFDTAVAKIYENNYQEEPEDLIGKSFDF